ncbi:hypothetical protein HDU67_008120 [Dinochytrium kinnereticum]|nr:hypothetical protein HDU67_008120 [Dinochytrium kinnereticum]
MSAGFDTGVAITVAVIFLVLTMPQHLMPWWAMKRFDQEVCAPKEFLEFCELPNGQPNPLC